MSNESDEIHPLDRDYSVPHENPVGRKSVVRVQRRFDVRLRQAGITLFLAGLAATLISAAYSQATQTGMTPRFQATHIFSALLLLLGGLVILLAYRLEQAKSFWSQFERLHRNSPYAGLVTLNVILMVAILLAAVLVEAPPGVLNFILVSTLNSVGVAFLVTLTIWNRGYLRAYAIGTLVGWFSSYLTSFSGGFMIPGADPITLLLLIVGRALLAGLICAGYVAWLEKRRDARAAVGDPNQHEAA
ncbi:MAG: hypothetical protein AAGA03_00290 [Planctomycetota bacterium]